MRFTPLPTHTAEMMNELTSALVEIFGPRSFAGPLKTRRSVSVLGGKLPLA